MICPECQNRNRPDASFCDECGHRFARPAEQEAERRLLTVLFCDVVNSTGLAAALDPEEFREVLRQLQAEAEDTIVGLGGRVAQLLGDGLMAYFGHPTAHDDDPMRALKAAGAILETIPRLNTRLSATLGERSLAVRIGVHTGLVVVGEMGGSDHHELLALGDTPNVAAHIQELAQPGTAVLSDATRRLVGPGVRTIDLGERQVRGLGQSVRLHELASVPTTAAEDTRVHRLPLIARESELGLLANLWRTAATGHGQLAVVSGDAGIGKTRLVDAFRERLDVPPATDWLEWRGSPLYSATAFRPIVEGILSLTGISANDEPGAIFEALRREFDDAPGMDEEAVPLIANLLSLTLPERHALAAAGASVQRARVLETLRAWIASRCARAPLVLVIEDLHWVDPSTKEFLRRLESDLPKLRCMLLYTFRDGYQLDPPGSANLHISLSPLDRASAQRMVRAVIGAQVLSEDIIERVMERADGVPLFLEEITQAVLESASDLIAAVDVEVPHTLQSSLMARLDRLGPSKAVVQRAAVLGREVPIDLLRSVLGLRSQDLDPAIEALSASGLARVVSGTSGRVLAFKHALVRKLAEESLLRTQRRELHAQAVDAIEADFPEIAKGEPERMARHCRGANRPRRCIEYLRRASEQAMERSAHAEAMTHIDEAISMLDRVPDDEERILLELDLNLALGAPLAAAKGYGHPDVERTHVRARELSFQVHDESSLYTVAANLFLYHASRADLDSAEEEAMRLVEMGERDGESYCLRYGESFRGVIDYYRGLFESALVHFERAIALIDDQPAPAWYCHEHRPTVVAHAYGSLGLGVVGEFDRARRHSDASLEEADGSPLNEGFAIGYAVLLSQLLDDPERALALAERGVAICTKHDFPMYLAIASLARGWARVRLGDVAHGMPDISAGLAIGASTGTIVEGPRAFAISAEAHLLADQTEGARTASERGLALAASRGNRFWDAELLRVRAICEMQDGETDAARATIAAALHEARTRKARALERRVRSTAESYRIESSSGAP